MKDEIFNHPHEQDFWLEYAEEEKKHEEKINHNNSRIIKAILKVKGFNWLCNFLYDYRECECHGMIEFTDKPKGQEQSDYWGKSDKGVFVEQYCSGEDSYHGYIYFPVKSHKYLKCPFEC